MIQRPYHLSVIHISHLQLPHLQHSLRFFLIDVVHSCFQDADKFNQLMLMLSNVIQFNDTQYRCDPSERSSNSILQKIIFLSTIKQLIEKGIELSILPRSCRRMRYTYMTWHKILKLKTLEKMTDILEICSLMDLEILLSSAVL